MSIKTNKAMVKQFIVEVWNEDKLEVLDDQLDPAYYDYSYQPRNREGLERTLEVMRVAFPDHKTIIEEIVGEGDTVAVCFTLRGTHLGTFRGIPASGKQIEVGGYRWYRIANHKIISQRGLLDLPSLLQQIGANS